MDSPEIPYGTFWGITSAFCPWGDGTHSRPRLADGKLFTQEMENITVLNSHLRDQLKEHLLDMLKVKNTTMNINIMLLSSQSKNIILI